ncbi:MAG TPA: PaaX family transcriptional regulator C-terminal domain-containing protein [Streptomyces sp.]|nr:PaaX family transcriptional regulator C-terminal domain-containing protein [Streptomyces sp.]
MRRNVPDRPGEPVPRPLSARSVVLSLLLGTDPAGLPARELTRAVERFDVGGSTLRAALSRMVAAGDLRRTETGYRLSDRLLERRLRQDEAVAPRTRAWDGDWEMVVITATGRGPAERAELRTRLTALRLAELREGVWLRPANLRRPLPDDLHGVAEYCTARPARPARETAAVLWPLDAWAATARALLRHVGRAEGRAGGSEGLPDRAGGPLRRTEGHDARAEGRVNGGEGHGARSEGDVGGGEGHGVRVGADMGGGEEHGVRVGGGFGGREEHGVRVEGRDRHAGGEDRPAARLAAYAAVVRHLLTDPVLPPELLPADWPGPALRTAYADYRRELTRTVTAGERGRSKT